MGMETLSDGLLDLNSDLNPSLKITRAQMLTLRLQTGGFRPFIKVELLSNKLCSRTMLKVELCVLVIMSR